MLNSSLRIKVVQNRIGVTLVSGCENEDVEVFTHIFDDFFGMGADIDVAADNFALEWFEWNFDLISFHHDFTGVYESLIHVKNDGFST